MSSDISVLHVIDSLAPGGAERVLVELVNHLSRPQFRPFVCVTRDSDMTLGSRLKADVPIYQLKRRRTWDMASLRQFGQIVKRNQIQIIHAHGYSSSRFVMTARWLSRLDVTLVMHAHSYTPPDWLTALLGRFGVDHFIGVSPNLITWGQKHMHLGPEHTTLLGNAIPLEPYLTATPIATEPWFPKSFRLIAVIVANVRPIKDFQTLFQAINLARNKTDIGLLVVGSTADTLYMQQCQAWIEAMELKNQVRFLGSRQDVPALINSADAGLLSSRLESGPLALLEYMAGGIPFVVTQVGQVGQAVADAGLKGTVPPGDINAFAQALDELVALSPSERKARGERGRTLFRQNFSLESRLNTLQSLYQTLVK